MSGVTRVVELTVPRLGETMEQGVVRDWLKAVGDTFERGDAIVEIETDKTIAEVPALLGGRLVERLADSGDSLAVGAPLARVEVAVEDAATGDEPIADSDDEVEGRSSSIDLPEAPVSEPRRRGERVRATPAARRLARERGVALDALRGSGRLGRIETGDVEALAALGGAIPPAARTVTTAGGGDLVHDVDGPEGGQTFLLLHGFAADRSAWAATVSALARAGHRAIVPDLPGHGETTIEARTVDNLSLGLESLASRVVPRGTLHVVAHSLGAAPALALVERMPVASLTLIAPAGVGSFIDAEFVRGMASPASAGELAHLLRRLSSQPNPLSNAALAALFETLSRGRLQALAECLLGASGQALDLVPAVERAAQALPVRVIVGHADRIVDWRDACAISPRVAVHHLSHAGHMPHWDALREVVGLLGGVVAVGSAGVRC